MFLLRIPHFGMRFTQDLKGGVSEKGAEDYRAAAHPFRKRQDPQVLKLQIFVFLILGINGIFMKI